MYFWFSDPSTVWVLAGGHIRDGKSHYAVEKVIVHNGFFAEQWSKSFNIYFFSNSLVFLHFIVVDGLPALRKLSLEYGIPTPPLWSLSSVNFELKREILIKSKKLPRL